MKGQVGPPAPLLYQSAPHKTAGLGTSASAMILTKLVKDVGVTEPHRVPLTGPVRGEGPAVQGKPGHAETRQTPQGAPCL